jgi:hypothetical protein
MTTVGDYLGAIRGGLDQDMLPTWTPEEHVELGDYGHIAKDGDFTRLGNLAEHGLKWEVHQEPHGAGLWSWNTSGSVRLKSNADAADALSGTIEFTRKKSAVFSFKNFTSETVTPVRKLEQAIDFLWGLGGVPPDEQFFVVWKVWKAASGTIVVSSARKASVDIAVEPGLVKKLSLPAIGVGVEWGDENSLSFKMTSKESLTPFFHGDEYLAWNPTAMSRYQGFEWASSPQEPLLVSRQLMLDDYYQRYVGEDVEDDSE